MRISPGSGEIEAIRFITLSQAATKSCTNDCVRVVTRVDFGEGPELGVRTEDQIDARACPLELARLAIVPLEDVFGCRGRPATCVFMSSRLTKKSLVSVSGRLVKTPCLD